jgi:nucleotide-binding universal stress UspA family protein
MSRLILVPLDGSGFSESAIPVALAIARRWEARVEVLTVHEGVPTLEHDFWETASQEWSDRYIAGVADRIETEAGVTVEASALSGAVGEAIQRHVEAQAGTLLVMASHGRGPMSRFWLGSTADALVRHSTFPILLLRPDGDVGSEPPETYSPKRVLVPLDGSNESEAILEHAIELVDDREAVFTLLRVFPYPEQYASTYMPHTIQVNADLLKEGEAAARVYIEAQAAALVERGIEATGEMCVETNPAAGILRFAERNETDLIAMSTHGRGGVSRMLLGSVTDKVLRGAQIPMLVYHPHDA